MPASIGLQFQLRIGLTMDVRWLRGSFPIGGNLYQGRLVEADACSSAQEEIRATVKDKDVNVAIQALDLSVLPCDGAVQEQLWTLPWERRAVFKVLGDVKGTAHVIDMKPDAKPVFMPGRQLSPRGQEAERTMVNKLRDAGVMEPSESANAARNVSVPEKDFGLRCTGDFRGINDQMVPDPYPAEDPQQDVEGLAGRQFCHCLDVKDGYSHVRLAEDSRRWTAVATCLGLFQYTRLAQGLKDSGAMLQRIVNTILGDLRGKTKQGYTDDLSVGTDTAAEHVQSVALLLDRLLDFGIHVKLSKCVLWEDYLGKPGVQGITEIYPAVR